MSTARVYENGFVLVQLDDRRIHHVRNIRCDVYGDSRPSIEAELLDGTTVSIDEVVHVSGPPPSPELWGMYTPLTLFKDDFIIDCSGGELTVHSDDCQSKPTTPGECMILIEQEDEDDNNDSG